MLVSYRRNCTCGADRRIEKVVPSRAKYMRRTLFKISDYKTYDVFVRYVCDSCGKVQAIAKDGHVFHMGKNDAG